MASPGPSRPAPTACGVADGGQRPDVELGFGSQMRVCSQCGHGGGARPTRNKDEGTVPTWIGLSAPWLVVKSYRRVT